MAEYIYPEMNGLNSNGFWRKAKRLRKRTSLGTKIAIAVSSLAATSCLVYLSTQIDWQAGGPEYAYSTPDPEPAQSKEETVREAMIKYWMKKSDISRRTIENFIERNDAASQTMISFYEEGRKNAELHNDAEVVEYFTKAIAAEQKMDRVIAASVQKILSNLHTTLIDEEVFTQAVKDSLSFAEFLDYQRAQYEASVFANGIISLLNNDNENILDTESEQRLIKMIREGEIMYNQKAPKEYFKKLIKGSTDPDEQVS